MRIFLSFLALLFIIGCSNKNIIHLRDIPIEVVYNGYTYRVIPAKTIDVGKEIGLTEETNFKVFKIKNINPKDSIGILVRDKDPILFYKAVRK